MSKPHKIKLAIPNPCNEDWNKMTSEERGRFCNHCNKAVIDFSNFTDRELVDYITKAKDRICGRFNIEQLDRTIAVYTPADSPIFRRMILAGTMAAGIAGTAHGQTHLPQNTTIQSHPTDTSKKPNESKGIALDTIQVISKRPEVMMVMGATTAGEIDTVSDIPGNISNFKTGRPLANVVIIITKNRMPIDSAVTDNNGNFHLNIGYTSMDKKLRVSVIHSGYRSYQKNIVFYNDQLQPLFIKLKEN